MDDTEVPEPSDADLRRLDAVLLAVAPIALFAGVCLYCGRHLLP